MYLSKRNVRSGEASLKAAMICSSDIAMLRMWAEELWVREGK